MAHNKRRKSEDCREHEKEVVERSEFLDGYSFSTEFDYYRITVTIAITDIICLTAVCLTLLYDVPMICE